MVKHTREEIEEQIHMLKTGTGCNNTKKVIEMLEAYMHLQEALYEMVNKYSS